ncbi:MAG: peptide chain release factor N(5)-glutamine methyltransferase [Elusimicrobia bacterium]|nr:peptide chain release factor N(5)-glutamine methyltransferase [Elusimicrobiota bacterium]
MPTQFELRTYGRVLRLGERFLKDHRCGEPRASAEFLLAHVTGESRTNLYLEGDRALGARAYRAYSSLLKLRARGMPVSYVVKEHQFMGLRLRVSPMVLVPRPETELLVEKVLARVKSGRRLTRATVFDVGTGSGCIAIAIAAAMPGARIFASDVSLHALKVARANAAAHGTNGQIRFLRGDLLKPFPSQCDIFISNPPYLSKEDLSLAPPELRWEPRVALDGGPSGRDVLGRLISEAPGYLNAGGFLALEIGEEQGSWVEGRLSAAGFDAVEVARDDCGADRFAFARLRRAGTVRKRETAGANG